MAGHVEKRGPKRWFVVYYTPDGRRRGKSFTRKIDADRFLASTTVDVLRGDWIDPTAGRITFGEYAAAWVDQRPIRNSTRQCYVSYIGHMRELGPIPLADLQRGTVRKWQQALSQRTAKSTARTIRGVAASIAKDAVLDRLIPSSPFDGVKAPPRPDRVLVEPLPLDHVAAVREAIVPRYACAITVGQGVGLRRGEAFGLTVDRIDFLRRTIKIDRQLLGARDGLPVFGPPKTDASNAVVPVAQSVLDELAAHLAAYPPTPGEGWYDAGDGRLLPITHDGLVFTSSRSNPVARPKVGQAWRDAEVRVWARATGQPLGRGGRIPAATRAAWQKAHTAGHGNRFHDLRHVFASTLIDGGVSVVVVQRLMRHASAEETLRTYSHMWPADDDKARGIIDGMLTRHESDTRATAPETETPGAP